MTHHHDIEQDLAIVYAVEPDAVTYERALESTLARVELEFALADVKPIPIRRAMRGGRRRRRLAPIVVVLFIMLMLLGALAIAETERFFGNNSSAPANHAQVLSDPKDAAPPEPHGPRLDQDVSMRSLLEPSQYTSGDVAFLKKNFPQVDDLLVPTPGHGDLLPLDTNLRLLLDAHLDGTTVQIAAIPTTTGSICWWSWKYPERTFGGSCVDRLDDDHPVVGATGSTDSNPIVAYGLVTDGVRAIHVRLSDDRTEPATLGRNAYAWRASSADIRPRGLLVEFTDGRTVELSMLGGAR